MFMYTRRPTPRPLAVGPLLARACRKRTEAVRMRFVSRLREDEI